MREIWPEVEEGVFLVLVVEGVEGADTVLEEDFVLASFLAK